MIKRNTVFVIGAGAHCPYGFPDGNKLTKTIVEMLPTDPHDNNNEFRDMFFQMHSNEIAQIGEVLVDFRKKLDNGGHSSIDSFLATYKNKGGFSEVGKFAVAKCLLPMEFQFPFNRVRSELTAPNHRLDQDWLSHLFTFMHQGCLASADEFIERNKVTFLTFNYDRTLEWFLHHRLVHTYGLSDADALAKLRQIPIIHIYGSLGEFRPPVFLRGKPIRDLTPPNIRDAGSSIRLMYEDREDQPEIVHAKEAISKALCVCFLGFSFDPDNVARLELSKLCSNTSVDTGNVRKALFACRYAMPDGEWHRGKENLAPATFLLDSPDRGWDALQFLKETRALG